MQQLQQLLGLLEAGLPRALVWGLVPRVVGALYVIAFASLSPQIMGLVGSRGVAPARAQLSAMREHFPGPLRFLRLPTLLWLGPSDALISALPRLGMLAGLFVVFGGPGSWWGLCVCFLLYLSLDVAALMFPWDCLLFEAGFLALFLPETRALPELASSATPLPIAVFALQFLLIRLMWGFAKLKFIGTKPGDSLYLQGFLAWMPMCTPLGHRMQRAPAWFLRVSYGFMWFAEVVCPGLALLTGVPRLIGALGLMGLMGGIWATGNWGFFNLGYGALCLALFDTRASIFDTSWALVTSSPGVFAVHVLLALHTLAAVLWFPGNSWATHVAAFLPLEPYLQRWPSLRAVLACFRVLSPLRLIHAYGVFPPNGSAPIKLLPVFEGSTDGVTFRAYPYRFMPIAPHSRPPIVAPHHPRLDHLCVYAGSGMSESDYLASVMGAGKPYGFSPFSHFSWLDRVAQRLLEGEPSVRALFAADAFADGTPRLCRVSLRALTPNPERAHGGAPWQARDCGVLLPARAKSDAVFRHWLSPPELMHPDAVYWRKQSPALGALLSAFDAGTAHEVAVRTASDLRADEVALFWEQFVPLVARRRGDFAAVDDTARELRERFDFEARLRFERIAERYVHLLRHKLEPYLPGVTEPKPAPRWNFTNHLLLQEFLLDGREVFEALLRDPSRAAARAEQSSHENQLHFIAVVRSETLRYQARALRIVRRVTNVFEAELPGILEYRDLLTRKRPAEEIWRPECACSDSGVWRFENFAPSARAGGEPSATTDAALGRE
jgi:lipase maturation factor 1